MGKLIEIVEDYVTWSMLNATLGASVGFIVDIARSLYHDITTSPSLIEAFDKHVSSTPTNSLPYAGMAVGSVIGLLASFKYNPFRQ